MITVDYRDGRPIYEQIIERVKLLILKDVMKAGEPMPSVRSLAMELSINPNTIQRAYQELERQGFIYSVKGKGSFISDLPSLKDSHRQELLEELKGIVIKMDEAGFERQEIIDAVNSSIPDRKE